MGWSIRVLASPWYNICVQSCYKLCIVVDPKSMYTLNYMTFFYNLTKSNFPKEVRIVECFTRKVNSLRVGKPIFSTKTGSGFQLYTQSCNERQNNGKKKMFFMKLHEILYNLNKSDFLRKFGLSGISHARWKELETQFSSAKNQLGVLTLSTKLRIAQWW